MKPSNLKRHIPICKVKRNEKENQEEGKKKKVEGKEKKKKEKEENKNRVKITNKRGDPKSTKKHYNFSPVKPPSDLEDDIMNVLLQGYFVVEENTRRFFNSTASLDKLSFINLHQLHLSSLPCFVHYVINGSIRILITVSLS